MPANYRNHRPYTRFMRWMCIMLASYFAITALLSLVVDPWRINNTPLSIDALDESREISSTLRVGKAALANKGDWETVFLGSSIIEIGLDPTHPAFGKQRTVNLGMAAAGVLETIPVGNYILDRNPDLTTLIFGIDMGDLHSDFDSRKFTRFYESPYADNNVSVERGIGQLIGGRSLVDSVATVRRYFKKEPTERSSLGQWLRPNHPPNLRNYLETTFKRGFFNPDNEWAFRPQKVNQTKADQLLGFISRVRRAGIQMHIVITPHHALRHIHPFLNEPDKMVWEHDMLALADVCRKANSNQSSGPPVSLWNFMTFNKHTTTPLPPVGAKSQQMPGWFDLGHTQPELGNHIIETVLSGKSPTDVDGNPFGVNLLQNDWESIRQPWIAGHLSYCKNNPEDISWWRGHISISMKKREDTASKSREPR